MGFAGRRAPPCVSRCTTTRPIPPAQHFSLHVTCDLQCKACGFVSDVDPRHKLNTFILKNPPENKLKKEEQK